MRIILSIVALWSIMNPLFVMAGGEQAVIEYENNIGFMINVPQELRQELPMCDEFLDVKWIREMPCGYWVGRVIVDVKIGNTKEQRELVVLEENRRPGRLLIFDITTSNYRGHQFEELVIAAERVRSFYVTPDSDILENGLAIIKNRKQIVVCDGFIGSQSYLQKGLIAPGLIGTDKRICITLPSKERWLVNKK